MGGSWARSEDYLRCGYRLGISGGIRHPDLGFRPVREPEPGDWAIRNRNLCAIALGDGKMLDDGSRAKFQVAKGDKVIFSSYAGTEIKVGVSEYMLMDESDILAILD